MIFLKKMTGTLRRYVHSSFSHLRWSLQDIPQRVAVTAEEDIMNPRARSKRYPIRALRYWWARRALMAELKTADKDLVVADMGCSRGHIRRFVGDEAAAGSKWVGLDWEIDRDALVECGYSELHECDFDQPLPLPDNSVDVVVFLHVIEHLPRPYFTMAEIGRILRPGGLLIAGSPVAPAPAAKLREHNLRSRMKKGLVILGGHINSMDCGRWRKLALLNGMRVERMAGTFMIRCSKSPLENHKWWIRLNQIWGALFPALGGEVYLTVRKSEPPQPVPVYSPSKSFAWHLLRPANALAVFLLIIAVVAIDLGVESSTVADQVADVFHPYRDSNNDFFILRDQDLSGIEQIVGAEIVNCPISIREQFEESDNNGRDAYLLVSENANREIMSTIAQLDMQLVDEVLCRGERFSLFADRVEK